ncbi:MAG: PIN domain-containing protein [Bifidobacteriaceae bacterium]|jgi:PIN domain nuclease of toxin-antitoxin system|nr:PIN domain-containing protein [Bifidobacteriaceae bacterium]
MTALGAGAGCVVDASALLAYLFGETGKDAVRDRLRRGGAVCSAANWSELAQKVGQKGKDWSLAKGLLSRRVNVVPVTQADAEAAARLWPSHPELSLGDRLCLALRQRLAVPAVTADLGWAGLDGVELIR